MNRLWCHSSALFLCLAQLLAVSTTSQAADKAAGETLLPKDTLIFFTISNVPEMKQKWEKGSMGQLLHDPQLKPFLDDVHKKIGEASDEMEKKVGVTLAELADVPHGELTLAVLPKPVGKLSVVLALEFGESKATVEKLLKKMDEALDKEEAEHSNEEISKINVHTYKLKNPEPNNPFQTINYFTTDSHLVFSTEIDALKDVIERWDGSSDDTLAQNDQYKYIQNQCKLETGTPVIKWYFNPIGLIQSGIAIAQEAMPQAGVGMAGAFLPLFGFDGWKGWGGAIDMDEGDFEAVSNSFVYAENPKGVLAVFLFPATQLVPPKWVPADIGSYVLANWDVNGAYTAIETLVDSFSGRGATARFLDNIAEEGPMIHVKKDVIDHLDGKLHLLQADLKPGEGDGPPTPQMLFGFGLKDPAKMKKTLAAAAKASPNLDTREFNGENIYEFSPPNGDQTISVVVTEGNLVITNDTPLLEGMMRGQSGRAALAESDDYKRIAKYFPSKTSMLSFQRGDAQLKVYYNMLKNSDNFMDGIDVSKLPSFDVIAKYLQPSGGYTVPDKKGAKSVSFSPKRND